MNLNWRPAWSKVEKIESGGRYPLGLNRFHNGLEDLLIKSITELANRLRYITYYCWAIGDCHETNENLNYRDFVNTFCRIENALAVGIHLLQPDYSYNGKDNPNVRSALEQKECNLDFQLMQSNHLGAFGLYYVGSMQNFGLVEINTAGVYSLTPKGKELYEIYKKYLLKKHPEYYRKYKGKEIVPSKVLLEWGKTNDLGNINEDLCIEERNFYKSLLFHLDKKQVVDYRRHTLCLFLESINQCQLSKTSFSEDILRTINYYGYYFANNKSKHKFDLPDYLSDAYYYWTIYEGHGYFRGWLERYFQVFLEFLKSEDKGATFEEFFNTIDHKEFNTAIRGYSGENKDYFKHSLDEIFNLYKKPSPLESPISEESLLQNEKTDNKNTVLAKFVLTMVSIVVKFEKYRHDDKFLFIQNQRIGDLWFDRLYFMPSLKKMTVGDFLKKCLKDYIIRQHDLIMFEKHDLRRCWFTKEQDKYFFQAEVTPIWRPAKYRTLLNFLRDMNLIEQSDGQFRLTAEGRSLYGTLKKEYFP
jgi:hypothetical protein